MNDWTFSRTVSPACELAESWLASLSLGVCRVRECTRRSAKPPFVRVRENVLAPFDAAAGTGGLKLVLSRCSGVKAAALTRSAPPPSSENQRTLCELIWLEDQLVACYLVWKAGGNGDVGWALQPTLQNVSSKCLHVCEELYTYIKSVCFVSTRVISYIPPPTRRPHLHTSGFKNTGSRGNQQQTEQRWDCRLTKTRSVWHLQKTNKRFSKHQNRLCWLWFNVYSNC